MFEFIKRGLEAKGVYDDDSYMESSIDEIDDDLFIESAHVLEELSDLTKDGLEDSSAIRKLSLNIPTDEDLEIDTIEFDPTSGLVKDAPMDATLQESYYSRIKTPYDFFVEAEQLVQRLPRESEEMYENRVYKTGQKMYKEYMDTVVQEGLFGFGKMKLDMYNVAWNIKLTLCDIDDGDDVTYNIPVAYEVDKKHRIFKKQAETISFFDRAKVSNAKEALDNFCKNNNIKIPKNKTICDIFEPTKVISRMEPEDHYVIDIIYKCSLSDDDVYMRVSVPIKEAKKKDKGNVKSKLSNEKISLNNKSFIDKAHCKDFVEESEVIYRPSRFGDYYQEAIDFGGGSELPPGLNETSVPEQQDAPPAIDNGGGAPEQQDAPPAIDTGDSGAPDMSLDAGGMGEPNPNVNDVSEEIADKVNSQLNDNASDDSTPDADIDDSSDMDTSTDTDLDSNPDVDIDNGSEEIPDVSDEEYTGGDVDVDNMTIDQLKELAAERVEGMTINQIKDFLSSNDNTNSDVDDASYGDLGATTEFFTLRSRQSYFNESSIDDDITTEEDMDTSMNTATDASTDNAPAEVTSDADIQETFIYTKKNINSSMDVLLRKALGILNDNTLELSDLIKAFKNNGKKLNKCLVKATKIGFYSSSECKTISDLNKALLDVMSMVKKNQNDSDLETAKKLIKEFTKLSKQVGKIIDEHKEKSVQG